MSHDSIRGCVHPSVGPSVGWSVGPSVGPSVGWSVCNAFARRAETSRRTTYFAYTNLIFIFYDRMVSKADIQCVKEPKDR